MEASPGVIVAMFSILLGGVLSLFGWTLWQVSTLGRTQVQMDVRVMGLVTRIDLLVTKIDANFALQINEQIARNILQEKVANIDRAVNEQRDRRDREMRDDPRFRQRREEGNP